MLTGQIAMVPMIGYLINYLILECAEVQSRFARVVSAGYAFMNLSSEGITAAVNVTMRFKMPSIQYLAR